jgi:hypothetical protein
MTPTDTSGEPVVACPSCGAQASGKFCSNCGATLTATTCAACNAPLAPGAKFCHRCGTPAGSDAPREERSFSSGLPWAVAAIALVALIALIAGQRFGRSPDSTPAQPADQSAAAPFAGATGGARPPDISNLSPAEAAVRLYNRVMGAHERGQADTVQMFAPMAITAYQMLGTLDNDQRYDMGRIAAVSGDDQLARAEADTILASNPNHLLGLILAANAAHIRKDAAAEKSYRDRLAAAVKTERAKQLPEYVTHENDINIALDPKAVQP